SINIDGRDCCQTGQPSQDVTDGALTSGEAISPDIR
ncbi:transposase, partial [Escherichia coli]